MNNTKIEWCDMTWNPVTGCLHGCEYCYARRISERFGTLYTGPQPEAEGLTFAPDDSERFYELDEPVRNAAGRIEPYPANFYPTLHRYRMDEPAKKTRTRTVFVCSMADLFGAWVPYEWIAEVFAACRKAPQHRYLFLTKNPARYLELASAGLLPENDNFWYGSTATRPDVPFWWSCHYNTFVSIEPMLEEFPSTGDDAIKKVGWVILGAMTGPGSKDHQPKQEWVESLTKDAHAAGVPVFMKDSLVPIVGKSRMFREFPWMVQASTESWVGRARL